MKQKPKKIVVCLDVRHRASQEVIAGILRFAATRPEWILQMRGNHPSNDGFAIDDDWRPDGMIIDSSWTTREGKRLIAAPSLRGIIFTSTIPPNDCQVPHEVLTTDDRALAVSAMKLFLRHGLSNFAFVGAGREERWSVARRRFFENALKDAGYPLAVYRPVRSSSRKWKAEFAALSGWIAKLPKPCGILAAHDQRAKHVLDVCRLTGIKVPEQVQVMGIDDEEYICEQTVPSLSSVIPDFERGGFAAAEALNSMLAGRQLKTHRLKIPLQGITERLSTTDISGSGTRVSRAQDFIRLNATRHITVAMVAKASGGSVRLLEKNFKKVVGHGVCKEIQLQRLELVKKMLRETSRPVSAVAEKCGFKNEIYLMNLFRKKYGITMSEFRRGVSPATG